MKFNNEIWKDVVGYEGFYQVSNYGNVKSLLYYSNVHKKYYKRIKNISKIDKGKGYLVVALYKNGERKDKKVHRLVAEAFIPNPNNYPCVNHKDENPSNNYYENLEWCSYQYNCIYGTRIKRIRETKIRKGLIKNGI